MPLGQYDNLAQSIGRTPLVRLQHSFPQIQAQIWAKVEYFNPGLSVKDRVAWYSIQKAEAEGKLKPGGTVIESTSGNTGIGLAICAASKSYRCICVMNTQHSPEKIKLLKAYGAEVVICDGKLARNHPQSSYRTAARLAEEIPNSYWINQYVNPDNPEAHYRHTGPEIWQQSGGAITHLIASASTGGTISGAARYLKEQNPAIQVWASDAYGSAFQHYHQTGEYDPGQTHPYLAENVGKKFIPETIDFSLIDRMEKIEDGEAARMARWVARRDGLLLGYSCGAALAVAQKLAQQLKAEDRVVIICPDHGSRYMHTIYNDEWMEQQGFLAPEPSQINEH